MRRWLGHAVVLGAIALAVQAEQIVVTVSYYLPTGSPMFSGLEPFSGAAACSWNFELGTRLAFNDGRVVECLDRGLLGSSGHVDVFVRSVAEGRAVAAAYGSRTVVEVLDE